MNKFIFLLWISVQIGLAQETVTLVVAGTQTEATFSNAITLSQGNHAEIIYGSGGSATDLVVQIGGIEFEVVSNVGSSGRGAAIAGPAILKLKNQDANPRFSTLRIHRAGTASTPIPIPQEA